MPAMILPLLLSPRRPRRRKLRGRKALPLTLVYAEYDFDVPCVRLTFDRAIDISGLAGGAVRVEDPVIVGLRYVSVAGEAQLLAPERVQVTLFEAGLVEGAAVRMTVDANNGLAAAEDGGLWPGCEDLDLPYP